MMMRRMAKGMDRGEGGDLVVSKRLGGKVGFWKGAKKGRKGKEEEGRERNRV